MKIWFISDTHGQHKNLVVPNGVDIVIHAGDVANHKELSANSVEVQSFLDWFSDLPIKYKIFIAGNHDTSLEAGMFRRYIPDNIIYLEHEFVEVDGVKIFGSPYTPTFGTGWAFNKRRDILHKFWAGIPKNLDILITHGPPKTVLDLTENRGLEYCGCNSLLNKIKEVKPRYSVFGHVHEEGSTYLETKRIPDTKFINAAVVDLRHRKISDGLTITI